MGFVRGFWSDVRVHYLASSGGLQTKTAKIQSGEISAEHFDNRCFIIRVYLDSLITVKRNLGQIPQSESGVSCFEFQVSG